jgi:serine/threonine protein kinase
MKAGDLVLSRFELLAKIGEGGQGEVFRARDHVTRSDVAVKVSQQRGCCWYWLNAHEAEIVAALPPHPGLPSLIDAGAIHYDSVHAFAMPLVVGEPLVHALAGATPEFAALAVRSAADALCAAHAAGVVKGGSSAHDLLVGSRAVVLDFGTARFLEGARCCCTPFLFGPPSEAPWADRIAGDVAWLATIAMQLLSGRADEVLYPPLSDRAAMAVGSDLSRSAMGSFFLERFRSPHTTWPTMFELRDALDAMLGDAGITDPDAELAVRRAA